jgi:DNA-binding transcriptional LysR family regulator
VLQARLGPAFRDIGLALDALNQFRDTPFGKVRINAPNSIAPFVLGPVIGPLLAQNPNLEVEIAAAGSSILSRKASMPAFGSVKVFGRA